MSATIVVTRLRKETQQMMRPMITKTPKQEPSPYWERIIWRKVLKIVSIHIFAVYGVFCLPFCRWQTWLFSLVYMTLSGLSVTVGAHRLWCHRSFKAKLPFRIILMLCNCIAAQNDLYQWVRDHRVHHKYTETDADPHNMSRGFFFAHVGWLFVRKHPEVTRKGEKLDFSDVLADPVVRFQRKFHIPLVTFIAFLVPMFLPVYLWNETFVNAFFVPTMLRLVLSLNATWSVNSWAHLWGSKPYDKEIAPTESHFVSIWALGEGWHNFHHVFPFDYRCSELGFRFNLSKFVIDLASLVGWAYDLRVVEDETIEKKKWATGDGTRRHKQPAINAPETDNAPSSKPNGKITKSSLEVVENNSADDDSSIRCRRLSAHVG